MYVWMHIILGIYICVFLYFMHKLLLSFAGCHEACCPHAKELFHGPKGCMLEFQTAVICFGMFAGPFESSKTKGAFWTHFGSWPRFPQEL